MKTIKIMTGLGSIRFQKHSHTNVMEILMFSFNKSVSGR